MKINSTTYIIIGFFSILTVVFSLYSFFSYKIIFCDVGQGAATFLQLGTYQALIDTGPNSQVLSCIGKYIPFFDHTIETVIISHNQKDHNGGLSSLQNKYSIDHIYGPLPQPFIAGHTQFTEVKDMIVLASDGVKITINKASQSSNNINDSANVVTIETTQNNPQTIFLSSDINGLELKKLIPRTTTLLEVPHHGSKYGLFPDSLELAELSLAVISVGKKNSYGHPSKEALDILKAKKIQIWRTDEQGELVINLN